MRHLLLAFMLLFSSVGVAYADTNPQPVPVQGVTPDTARKWAGVGRDIADGISATAHGLNVEVNNFVTTPVGILSMFLLLWYMIGHHIFDVIVACALWSVIGSMIWKSFKIFHIPRTDVDSQGKKIDVYYKFNSNDAKIMSAIAHGLVFCILCVIMLNIIF